MILLSEFYQGDYRIIAFGKFGKILPFYEVFPKLPVMTVLRKDGRLIVSQMTKTVSRQFIAAHRFDQARHLSRAARHQRPL